MAVGSGDLGMGALACVLGPTLHKEAGRMDAAPASVGSPTAGFTAVRCAGAAKAANVTPGALANRDSNAIAAARRMVENRLSAEGASSEVANNKLTFFDRGVEAAKEAAVAEQAVYGQRSEHLPSAKGGEEIRAHRALDDLWRFSKNLGPSEMGIESQALVWIIGTHRFTAIDDVPAPQKAW